MPLDRVPPREGPDEGNGSPVVSVVISTFRRPDLLREALASLARQTVPTRWFEVVVVDNAGHARTRQVVSDLRVDLPCLRYVEEPRVGLSHARNRGWREARGVYVGFTDDDCLLPEDWLEVASGIIERHRPSVFGGPHRPFYLEPPPAWFKDSYGAGGHQGDRPRTDAGNLHGGNMFILREVLERLGGFNPDLGMTGATPAYGEETELQDRLRALQPDAVFVYDPRLSIRHLVRKEKMSLRWAARAAFGKGRSHVRAHATGTDGRLPNLYRALRSLLRLSTGLLMATVYRDRGRYPYLANYVYERTCDHLRSVGRSWERIIAGSQREQT